MSLQTNPAPDVKRNRRDWWLLVLIFLGLAAAAFWLLAGGLRVIGSLDPLLLWLAVMAMPPSTSR